jgi:hypothetical protein
LDHRYTRLTVMGIDRLVNSIAIHAGPTGSPLELTCWVVCVIRKTGLLISYI